MAWCKKRVPYLYNDGTAYNYGDYNPAAQPELNTVREVDYVSGCSLLIRGSFWKEMGGFDENYKVAYCEDATWPWPLGRMGRECSTNLNPK